MNNTAKTLTSAQLAIVDSYQSHYEIEPGQISFDGDGIIPSFDHEAISILTLRLTDLADISPTQVVEDSSTQWTVYSKATLADGRSRGGFGTCRTGETLANGTVVTNESVAKGVATARSFRQTLRNVGIDLHKCHQRFLQTGEVASLEALQHPRAAQYREVHRHAAALRYIVGDDDSLFRGYLAGLFDGRTSKDDLTDIELHRLLVNLRANVAAAASFEQQAA